MPASGSMLIPEGQTASLMDTEMIDLYSFTGTHGIRLPGTHRSTDIYTLYIKIDARFVCYTYLFIYPAAHICPEKER